MVTVRTSLIAAALLVCWHVAHAQRTMNPHDNRPRSIASAMQKSADDWNRGDLLGYCSLYKDAPDILLVGPTVLRGYRATLHFFQDRYRTPEKRGILSYSDLSVQPLDARFSTATGRFHLERTAAGGGIVDGYYLLVFERTASGWKLIRDDSSVLPKPR